MSASPWEPRHFRKSEAVIAIINSSSSSSTTTTTITTTTTTTNNNNNNTSHSNTSMRDHTSTSGLRFLLAFLAGHQEFHIIA